MKTARGYKNYFTLKAITATVSETAHQKKCSQIVHTTSNLHKGHDSNRDPPDEEETVTI